MFWFMLFKTTIPVQSVVQYKTCSTGKTLQAKSKIVAINMHNSIDIDLKAMKVTECLLIPPFWFSLKDKTHNFTHYKTMTQTW